MLYTLCKYWFLYIQFSVPASTPYCHSSSLVALYTITSCCQQCSTMGWYPLGSVSLSTRALGQAPHSQLRRSVWEIFLPGVATACSIWSLPVCITLAWEILSCVVMSCNISRQKVVWNLALILNSPKYETCVVLPCECCGLQRFYYFFLWKNLLYSDFSDLCNSRVKSLKP